MKDKKRDYMDEAEDMEEKRPKKRRRWPFALLGFFFGFLTAIGCLVLVVVLLINNPVKKTVGTIDKVTDAGLYETLFGDDDDLGILDESYGDKSLKDVLTEISNIAQKGNTLTFADLNEISPQVEKTLDNLIEKAEEKSIVLDKNELLTTPLNEFSDLFMDEVKKIELGKVLLSTKADIFEDPTTGTILKNLLFGTSGINYTEINGTIEMLPITYTYDSNTDTFVCIDDTVYYKAGNVWREESGQYISIVGENFVLYSADDKEIYQLQSNATSQISTYTAVTIIDNQPQPVQQHALMLGAFMDKDNDLMAVIGELELGTLLGITTKKDVSENDVLLVTLAYGTYGVDFEYDGEDENSKIIPIQGGTPFATIGSLMNLDGVANLLRDIPLSDIFGMLDASPNDELLSTIGQWKIGEISTEKFQSIELRQIFDVESDDTGILSTLVNKKNGDGNFWTLGDLTPENINSLTIGEVLGDISDNFYLKHLSDSTLETLSDDINSLTVVDLFKDSIDYKTDAQGNIVYQNGHPVLKGTWKYLLTYNPDNPNSYSYTAPEDYVVTDMNKLIENMHNNIENATLNELHDDGLVPHLGEDENNTLDQKILPPALASKANEISVLLELSADQNITQVTIGDLTVLQVSDYLGFLLGEVLNP